MAKEQNNNKIEEFKKTIHYRDICHFIDYIEHQDTFNSCMEDLGYSIGLNLLTSNDDLRIKNVILGANGEFRVLTYIPQGSMFGECVICKV